ncbi:MAG TPA: TetR/AcrR family transcriptional regulator C-terminal domain-containing protein [Actinomycetota bacterium]
MTTRTRAPLTRDRVIEAALRLMDHEGLEAVTMRRVAREVGVEAMSLYHHVEDKDDLLDGICEQVMTEFRYPERTGDWAEDCRRAARAWRRLLKDHPNVMRLFAEQRGPARSVDSMRPMEFALGLIREAGISNRDTAQAFHAFGGYIQGFVMMELGSIAGGSDEAQLTMQAKVASELPEDFPTLRDVLPHFAECDADEQFEFGLDLLIRGLEAMVSKSPEPIPAG